MIRAIACLAIATTQLAFAASALAQHDPGARVRELERVIPELLEHAGVPGLSAAIVADGEVFWSQGFGVRSTETGAPVTPETVFEAASLSKPVFAYAVMQLVERGAIDLDRPLAEYLPYDDIEHDQRYRQVTARLVLSHSSGFPNWRPRGGQLTINFDPGAKFSYSGEGFVYLQRVVEQLTGEPMHTFMKRTVLEPLGMTHSSFVWEERFESNVALGHDEDGTVREKNKPELGNAAWSLQTTGPDFARFLSAVVEGRGLAAETVQAMLTPQSEVDDGVTWGLGWGLQESEVGRGFWHWGHNSGYRAYTLTYPSARYGFVFFANSNNGMLLLDALLSHAVSGSHPAALWLDYESYDSPKRVVRNLLEQTIRMEGVEAGIVRYQQLEHEYPAEAFEEDMLNSLGYRLMRAELLDAAIAIFRLNVEVYPDAFNTYDSLGEAYMERGELDLAIQNYEKSVKLNPENTNGVQMLERLRKMKKGGG